MAKRKVGKKKRKRFWLQEARERMEEKGSVGSFGKATAKKIAAGKRKGGKQKMKAVFAENMKKAAAKRKRRRTKRA